MNRTLELVEKIEALLSELKSVLRGTPAKGTKKATRQKSERSFSGLTGEIYELFQDGFFKEPQTISEIQNKLRLEGIKKPTTTLMRPLLLLVRKKVLGRSKGADGKGPFKYYQRQAS